LFLTIKNKASIIQTAYGFECLNGTNQNIDYADFVSGEDTCKVSSLTVVFAYF